jgi:hypothetical protein
LYYSEVQFRAFYWAFEINYNGDSLYLQKKTRQFLAKLQYLKMETPGTFQGFKKLKIKMEKWTCQYSKRSLLVLSKTREPVDYTFSMKFLEKGQ